MSEFFMDYRCINMGKTHDAQSDEKALDFYIHQGYEINGEMRLQVYIPPELRQKYKTVRVYRFINGVDIPENLSRCEYEMITIEENNISSNSVNEDGCILIRGENGELSGVGVLAFMKTDKDSEVPNPNSCYRYSVNYSKKDVISYEIIESKGKLEVNVDYPLCRQDMVLNILMKKGSKPVLVEDRKQRLMDNGAPVRVVLPAKNSNSNSISASFKFSEVDRYDFRLAFEDSALSAHYLLMDRSLFTLEDQKQRKIEMKSRSDRNIDRVILCPFCRRPFVNAKAKMKKNETYVFTCQGEVVYAPKTKGVFGNINSVPAKYEGKVTTICHDFTLEEEGFVNFHPILPEGYGTMPVMNVVVVGNTGSGKSVLLSSLYNMSSGKNDTRIECKPKILSTIADAFSSKGEQNRTAQEIPFICLRIEDGRIVADDTWDMERRNGNRKIMRRYAFDVGQQMDSFTKPDDNRLLSINPIGFRMGDMGFVFFYDVPGELFKSTSTDRIYAMDRADCIIAVLDCSLSPKEAMAQLSSTLSAIRSRCDIRDDVLSTMPVSVVLSKYDRKLEDLLHMDDDYHTMAVQRCFDPNCHICTIDTMALVRDCERYKGSELESHIEISSYEVEHYLKSDFSETRDLYVQLKKDFRNVRFFACSALGNDYCLNQGDGVTKTVLFRPRSLRTGLPIIWLMYQAGLIRE